MKKLFFAFLTIVPACLFAQTATITINVNRTISDIDPNIYGVFMEPIHLNGSRMGLPDSVEYNTLYGTVYDPEFAFGKRRWFSQRLH